MEHQHALHTCKNEKSYSNEVIPKYIAFQMRKQVIGFYLNRQAD
jgi:hypothetical protein